MREPKNVRVLTDLIKAHGSNPEVTPKWILALEQCYGKYQRTTVDSKFYFLCHSLPKTHSRAG